MRHLDWEQEERRAEELVNRDSFQFDEIKDSEDHGQVERGGQITGDADSIKEDLMASLLDDPREE